jgi:hypothetical protein
MQSGKMFGFLIAAVEGLISVEPGVVTMVPDAILYLLIFLLRLNMSLTISACGCMLPCAWYL